MLIENSIMKAFGAKLDWAAERLSFQDSSITIPATHMRRPIWSKHCSVIAQTSDGKSVPVWVSKKYVIPVAHEALIRVFSTARPQKDTLALIDPRVVTADTLEGTPQDEIWQTLVVARTVTHWGKKTKLALVQVGNPSDRTTTLKPKIVVGTISPVTAISPWNASAIARNHSESSQARIDLTAALDKSFKRSIFDDQQQTQLLDLCTKYRPVFSLTSKELGKYTIAEAEFPLQKNTKLVDHHPYWTNPRAQEVIDKCVESMESDGIIEKRPSAWGLPVCIVEKSDGSPRFSVDYKTTMNKFLVQETWPMPISSLISTQQVARNSSPFVTYRRQRRTVTKRHS